MEPKEEGSDNEKEIPAENNDPKFQCRFYEGEFPENNEVVMVRYKEAQEHNAKVDLLEYNNMEGMILASELTRKRTSQVSKHIRIGRKEPAMVLKVDKAKGFMDLSKIKVRGEESQKCMERYKKAKVVHTIMQRVAINCDVELVSLYKELVWPFTKDKEDYKALDVFKAAAQAQDPMSYFKGAKVSEDVLKELIRQISVKLSPHSIRIKADFEITCFTFEGIDAIREALLAGIQEGTLDSTESKDKPEEGEKLGVKIHLIAPPQYECVIHTKDKTKGIDLVNKALKKVEEVIKVKKGNFLKKSEPKVVGEKDEAEEGEAIDSMSQGMVMSEDEDEEGINVDIPDQQHLTKGKSHDEEEEKA